LLEVGELAPPLPAAASPAGLPANIADPFAPSDMVFPFES
jgi:hypothetical protein